MKLAHTTTNISFPEKPLADTIISHEALRLFQWIGFSLVCQVIDMFGTITNIINIICFIKLGFKDSVNVSFLGLAISDLFCVASLIFTNVCMNPEFREKDLDFDPIQVQYVTGGWPHVAFSRVTSWITAFITLEKCLCITAPLKVKGIFTSKRVTIIIVIIFVVLLASITPVFVVNQLGMVFFPTKNRTILALVLAEERETIEQVSFAFNNTFIPFSAFIVIIFCTAFLVVKLRNQTKWRMASATTTPDDKASKRDQRVIKMVVVISTLFILCFIPFSIIFIAMAIIPEFSVDGRYRNTNMTFVGIGFILQSTNSACNICIYYQMSSNYKQVIKQIFHINSCVHK